MDTIERAVAEDPKSDAGLGRVESGDAKATRFLEQMQIDDRDVEAGAPGPAGKY